VPSWWLRSQRTHDQEVSLDSGLGVEDDLLSLLGVSNGGDLDGTLVTEQGSERWLDETSSESEHDQENNEKRERGVGGDNLGNGGDDQQEVSDDTDGGTDADGLESTPLGVGDNSTKDRDNVGEESEHGCDSGSLDGTETESTGGLLLTSLSWGNGTSTVSTNGKFSSNEVLENVLTTVVRSSFTQLNETHGDTDPGNWGRYSDRQPRILFLPLADSLS
jgi:hypothetical protein